MASSWQPDHRVLGEILELLRQASSPDSRVQQYVAHAAQKLLESAEASYYLTFIFVRVPDESLEVRQQAGLLLKNHIWTQLGVSGVIGPHGNTSHRNLGIITSQAMDHIKPNVLEALSDEHKLIRSTAGTIITTIISAVGVGQWPEALNQLVELLNSSRHDVAEAAFGALLKIIEDELLESHRVSLDAREDSSSAGFFAFARSQFLPKIFSLLLNPSCAPTANVQKLSLASLNLLASHYTFAPKEPLASFFEQYWQVLGTMATVAVPEVRQLVVSGMISVLDFNEGAIFMNAEEIFRFMVECSGDADYNVRLEALDFWQTAVKFESAQKHIATHLPRLLPCLVENTKYSENDYLQMDSTQLEEDNAAVPDSDQDVQPRFHDTGDDEDDSSKGLWGSAWTVRKAAALALDLIAATFHEEVLKYVLPLVEIRLLDPDWELRESAVLTLGAISQGCSEGMSPFLPQVLHVLLGLCNDPKPLLRSISAWCVCRFSRWACLPTNRDRCLKPLLAKVLQLTLDRNKRVQEAACSAFAAIEEEARLLLVPFLEDICSTLSTAFTFYQAKNLLVLYDAVGTLADCVGSNLNKPELSSKLMHPIFEKWQVTSDKDFALIALFECITCLASALGEGFIPYSVIVVERCVRILQQYFDDLKRPQHDFQDCGSQARIHPISRELVDTCLDLLSAVVEALDAEVLDLLASPNCNFIPLLERCCSEPLMPLQSSTSVSSFALVGRLSKHCVHLLAPSLATILPELTRHLVHGSTSVCNNAAWAIGELTVKGGAEIVDPYVDSIAQQLCRVLQSQTHLKSLLQNACFTLARVGIACPVKVSQHLPHFLRPWCLIMVGTPNDREKRSAFEGVCILIDKNQTAVTDNVHPLMEAVASFFPHIALSNTPPGTPPPPPEGFDSAAILEDSSESDLPEPLMQMFRNMLTWLRNTFSTQWAAGWASLSLESQHALKVKLGATST